VDRSEDGGVAWDQVTHAYGPAVEVPGWISGLRDPGIAANCLSELYGSITHQGTRYSATPLAIPALIEAVRDPAVPDRAGVISLIQFCATGNLGDCLDWRCQRDLQASPHEQASWDAVAAGRERLRGLLADPDRAVAGAALALLAWTGDASDRILTAVGQALDSPAHLRDHANAQLRTAIARGFVLGTPPLRAYLQLNLGGSRPPATAGALPAETRKALLELLGPLSNWRNINTTGHRIYELEEFGLPGMPDHLATWLLATPS
jgi:HEAT repeat protein